MNYRVVRIRLLMLSGQLGAGGVPKVVLNVARHLHADVEALQVAYLGGNDDSVPEFRAEGLAVERLGPGFPDRRLPRSLARAIARFEPDVVHTHMASAGCLGRLVSRRYGVPVVSTMHNVYTERSLGARALDYPTSPLCAAVVSVSRAVERSLPRSFAPGVRSTVIHNCIDVPAVRARAALPWEDAPWTEGIPREGPIVASVARLSEKKGQHHLLRAFPQVLAEHPDATLVLTGWGERKATLEALARSVGVAESTYFLGKVDNPYSVLGNADVVAFPSRFEGFSIGMLEAMALGKPIVASDIGPFREALGPDQELVPVGEERALAERIAWYLDHPRRAAEDGTTARERVEAHFSGPVAAEKHRRLYRSLL